MAQNEETKRRLRWKKEKGGEEEEEEEKRDEKGARGENDRKKKDARRVGAVVAVVVAVDRDVNAVLFEERLVGLSHAFGLAPVLCVGRVPTRNTFYRC